MIFRKRIRPELTANPQIFPGERTFDSGKVRMVLSLAFASDADAEAFLRQNGLSTKIFDGSR